MVNNLNLSGVAQTPSIVANTFKRVTINQVDPDTDKCIGTDQIGKQLEIKLDYRPKGSGLPAENEIWMIQRTPAGWVLVGLVGHPYPVAITGSRSGAGTITLQLLAVLSDLGIVDDQTT